MMTYLIIVTKTKETLPVFLLKFHKKLKIPKNHYSSSLLLVINKITQL